MIPVRLVKPVKPHLLYQPQGTTMIRGRGLWKPRLNTTPQFPTILQVSTYKDVEKLNHEGTYTSPPSIKPLHLPAGLKLLSPLACVRFTKCYPSIVLKRSTATHEGSPGSPGKHGSPGRKGTHGTQVFHRTRFATKGCDIEPEITAAVMCYKAQSGTHDGAMTHPNIPSRGSSLAEHPREHGLAPLVPPLRPFAVEVHILVQRQQVSKHA